MGSVQASVRLAILLEPFVKRWAHVGKARDFCSTRPTSIHYCYMTITAIVSISGEWNALVAPVLSGFQLCSTNLECLAVFCYYYH